MATTTTTKKKTSNPPTFLLHDTSYRFPSDQLKSKFWVPLDLTLISVLTSHGLRDGPPLVLTLHARVRQQLPTLQGRQPLLGVRVQAAVQQPLDGGVQETRKDVATLLAPNLDREGSQV